MQDLGIIVVSYGGGVNSVALLVHLQRRRLVPTAILMADPGHEWPETYAYRDRVMRPWLRKVGFPDVTVVTREAEAKYRPRSQHQGTLGDECEAWKMLPSTAYGFKRCSHKYKITPCNWYVERQPWAHTEWNEGRRITRAVGFDAEEDARVERALLADAESALFRVWYPLYEAGINRTGCEDLIRDAGLPLPRKSACTFCPNSTLQDWRDLRRLHPDLFEYAVEMSRRAAPHIENPDVVGLMRCNPAGRRQLHVWAESDDEPPSSQSPPPMPCECAL